MTRHLPRPGRGSADSGECARSGDGDASNDTTVDLFNEVCSELDGAVLAAGDSVTCAFTLADCTPADGQTIQDTVEVTGHEDGDTDNTVSADDRSRGRSPTASRRRGSLPRTSR